MKAVVQHYIGTTEEWKAANPKLYEAVWGFEKTKDGKVLAKLGNGADLWNNLKYFDIENIHGLPEKFQEKEDAILSLSEALEAETQARAQGDTDTLASASEYTDGKLADEAQARQEADNSLNEALEAEAQARAQGDTDTLASANEYTDSKLAEEAQTREDAENFLKQMIAALSPEGSEDFLVSIPELFELEAQARAQGDTDTLISAKEYIEQKLKQMFDSQYYPGFEYIQSPGGHTPNELKAMGVFPMDSVWAQWSHRAERYELVPAASYPSGTLTVYASGQNVAADAYRIYQLSGDDRQIWKANKAISSTPSRINPLDWGLLPNIVRVRRCDLHTVWTDNDFAIGDSVTYNGVAYRVSGILVSGGKYRACEGGNRGTFNGAVAGDRIRNMTGTLGSAGCPAFGTALEVFSKIDVSDIMIVSTPAPAGSNVAAFVHFSASNIVPTGNDNSPRTITDRYWRLISKES